MKKAILVRGSIGFLFLILAALSIPNAAVAAAFDCAMGGGVRIPVGHRLCISDPRYATPDVFECACIVRKDTTGECIRTQGFRQNASCASKDHHCRRENGRLACTN